MTVLMGAMASPIIEATSLSSVQELASNPPSHPHHASLPGAEPLVLYIERVPGSRDVFLTPIKPREKVVTAEDVQSSLYYVHINGADDYDHETDDQSPSTDFHASSLPAITEIQPPARKEPPPPLPARRKAPPVLPPYPLDDPVPIFNARPPSPIRKENQIPRKPLSNGSPTRNRPVIDLPILPPRPLPTPPREEDEQPISPSLHEDNIRLLRRASHVDETNNPYRRNYSTHPETLKQLERESRPDAGSLTLIRRSPGSSEQWNVATIHDPPVEEVSSSSLLVPTAKRRTKKGGAPMYLDVTNEGYAQFIVPHRTEVERAECRISTATSASSSSSDSDPPPEGVFRRRLYMPGSRYAEHGYGKNGAHRKNLSVSAASGASDHQDFLRRSMRDERHSVDLGSISSPTADRRVTKGYTFASPWNGQCEFTTGGTGRSLKCRHQYTRGQEGSAVVETVSELRFNLPTSAKIAPTTVNGAKHRKFFSTHSFHSEDSDRSRSPTIMIDEDTRKIDLSLGQERAGGGFGGKQAKLGKLIIEPAGFGMLDLLVAANVGLWWRAWERV